MRIGRRTNGCSCEYCMQDRLKIWLREKELQFIDEFFVSEVSRRPDFLLIKEGHLINIEAKCNNLEEVMRQLKDNACYCDYSFAYIPDYCMTSREFKSALISSGYGLIIFNYKLGVITEVLEAHQNKEIHKELRKVVIARMTKELVMRKKKLDPDTQIKMEI